MKFICLLAAVPILFYFTGCTMLTAWRSIPPPGGCDQCHTAAITTDWKISYQPPFLSDERNREAFQTPEYNMQATGQSKHSSLELRKTEELRCFECHKSPDTTHRTRSGKFHH